jgi:hypothetical protein
MVSFGVTIAKLRPQDLRNVKEGDASSDLRRNSLCNPRNHHGVTFDLGVVKRFTGFGLLEVAGDESDLVFADEGTT